jgi:hypothetical protein
MPFNELQTEVQDNIERTTDQYVLTAVDTTGEAVTTSTGRCIQLTEIYVPTRGPNGNASSAIALVSWDGTNFMTYTRGSNEMFPGKGYGTNENQIWVKAYTGTVNVEIKMVS